MLVSYTIVKNVYIERTRTSNFMSAGRIIMNLPISKHLSLATIVMGMTLATSAMAVEVHKDSKANDLLCVTVNGGTTDALAVLRVEDDGQTQGLLATLPKNP